MKLEVLKIFVPPVTGDVIWNPQPHPLPAKKIVCSHRYTYVVKEEKAIESPNQLSVISKLAHLTLYM